MLDTIRKYVEAGMGALSSTRAEALAKKLASQGQARKDQVATLAHELADWSKKNGERLAQMIRREVKKQIVALGVATKADIERLNKRIAALEAKKPSTAKKTTTRKKTTTQTPKKTT